MRYSEKAIDRLIERMSEKWCPHCVLKNECELKKEINMETCKSEIKRVLTEWSGEE